jgi:hypothetical protein
VIKSRGGDRCARAANGHANAPPPRSVMNSRRFMLNDLHPRAQCAHGRKFLDRKPSIAMPFNASTRAPITQCNSLRRINVGIWLDVAAALT